MSVFQEQPLPFSVATVADLASSRARTANGGLVSTTGRDTPGDGGKADYLYHRTGRTGVTTDGGAYIAGPGSDDYWVLANRDDINIAVFDVDRTGATDCRSSIVSALAVLNGEGVLRFPRGTYLVSTSLTIDHRIVLEIGAVLKAANGAVITLPNGYEADDHQVCFDVSLGGTVLASREYVSTVHFGADKTGESDCSTILNAVIDTYKTSTTKIKVPSNATHLCNSTLTVSGSGNHLSIFGEGETSWIYSPSATVAINSSLSSAYTTIRNMKISGNGQAADGIYCRISATDITIENCDVSGFGLTGSTAQINCEDCTRVRIVGNRVSGGSESEDSLDSDIRILNCQDFEVSGNRCTSSNSEGIAISQTTTGGLRGTVVGNIITGHRRHGILFGYDNDQCELAIVGNRIHNCRWTGMYSIESDILEPSSIQGKCAIVGNVVTHCGGGYEADAAGNGGIHIAGRLGTTVVGNTVTDCGYEINGDLQTVYGRGIYLNGCSNVSCTGNTVKNCSRSGIEIFTSWDADGIAISGNSITDCVFACVTISNSGTVYTKSDLIVSDNVLRQVTRDGWGILIMEDAGGIEAAIHGNTIHGRRAGTDKAAIYLLRERAKSLSIFNNTIIDWDYGLQADFGTGEEEDWIIGIGCRMDRNTFISVDTPFKTRPVYAAVGRSNVFVNCNPGFSSFKVPATYENGVLRGYYVGGLPTRRCRNGDRLEPLEANSTQNLAWINNATQPAAKVISDSTAADNTITVTSHGFTAGLRVRVSGASLPAPLVSGQEYYVRSAPTANTIILDAFNSATSAIDITEDDGTGTIQALDYDPNWVQYPDPEGAPQSTYEDLALAAVNRWMGDADGDTNGDPDDSNGSADLAWTGTPVYSGTLPVGSEGKTFTLNGTDNVLTSGAGVGDYTDNFSLCGWINLTNIDSGDRFISKRDGSNVAWDFGVGGGGLISMFDSEDTIHTGNLDIVTGQWQHIAIVIKNGIGKFYVDGVQSGNDFYPVINSYVSIPVTLGSTLAGFYITGEMFDWRIYDTALSDSDLAKIVAGPQTNSRIGDLSYFNLTGTLVSIATVSDGSTNMVKAAVASTTVDSLRFDNGGADDGRLRYTDSNRNSFHVTASVSVTCAADKLIVVGLARNGTVIASTKMLATVGTSAVALALDSQIDLYTNDYVEVFLGNTTDDVDITVHSLAMRAS